MGSKPVLKTQSLFKENYPKPDDWDVPKNPTSEKQECVFL